MNRRSVLIGVGAVAAGLVGWHHRDQIQAIVDENLGPPRTENPIRELGRDGFLNRFVLYHSGAARMEFSDDYGCHERIAVGDTSQLRGSNLGEWRLPPDGELVVDMRAAVSKTKDPSNDFWLQSLGGKDSYCFGINGVHGTFAVPQDWIE